MNRSDRRSAPSPRPETPLRSTHWADWQKSRWQKERSTRRSPMQLSPASERHFTFLPIFGLCAAALRAIWLFCATICDCDCVVVARLLCAMITARSFWEPSESLVGQPCPSLVFELLRILRLGYVLCSIIKASRTLRNA